MLSIFFSVCGFLIDCYILYRRSYFKYKDNHLTWHGKRGNFQAKRDLYFILGNSKNKAAFLLYFMSNIYENISPKCLSCYIVVDIFCKSWHFFIISNKKLIDQGCYSKFSSEFGLMFCIHHFNSGSKF